MRTFTGNGTELYTYGNSTSTRGTARQGGVFTFNSTSVSSRVGISFVSTTQACSNVDDQIPAGTTIGDLVTRAQDRWATEVFSKVSTTEKNETLLTQLYSYLYGMHLIPSNRTGENSLWNSMEPSYDDFFTLWDLFRCSTPLWQILQPKPYEEIIRSLIDIWRHEGFLPDARSSEFTGRTQGGSNAENVLADAYVKGVRGEVNWEDAYDAMKTTRKSCRRKTTIPSLRTLRRRQVVEHCQTGSPWAISLRVSLARSLGPSSTLVMTSVCTKLLLASVRKRMRKSI